MPHRYQNGKLIAVLDPKNELYVQYKKYKKQWDRLQIVHEGIKNLGWVAVMEHMSMLSSIEDSKERDIENKDYCEMRLETIREHCL